MFVDIKKFILGTTVLIQLSSLFNPFVFATTMIYMSTKDMVEKSDLICIGKVKTIETRWNFDQTKIYTYVTITVSEVLKGESLSKIKDDITIKQLGGKVGNIESYLLGAPQFTIGEKTLVFLKPKMEAEKYFIVIGLSQGKYSVDNGSRLTRTLQGLKLLKKKDVSELQSLSQGKELFLDDFVDEIKKNIQNDTPQK